MSKVVMVSCCRPCGFDLILYSTEHSIAYGQLSINRIPRELRVELSINRIPREPRVELGR